jgi:hypothetical protein
MKKFLTNLATVHEDAWQKFLTNQLLYQMTRQKLQIRRNVFRRRDEKRWRFHVVAIAAGLLLAVSGPTFAAKRTLQKSDTKSAVKLQSRAAKFPYPYSRDDPYAPGVNWPKGA